MAADGCIDLLLLSQLYVQAKTAIFSGSFIGCFHDSRSSTSDNVKPIPSRKWRQCGGLEVCLSVLRSSR